MRLMFKAYFPSLELNHLHQTTDHLLNKIFSSESYLNKLNKQLYLDQQLANQAISHYTVQLLHKLRHCNYDNQQLL